jgi:hypothetical protein
MLQTSTEVPQVVYDIQAGDTSRSLCLFSFKMAPSDTDQPTRSKPHPEDLDITGGEMTEFIYHRHSQLLPPRHLDDRPDKTRHTEWRLCGMVIPVVLKHLALLISGTVVYVERPCIRVV